MSFGSGVAKKNKIKHSIMSENILELKNVNKSYRNHDAVIDLSFDMPKGSIFGLLGPNGAGKTSLIRIINSITRADSGVMLFDGETLRERHQGDIGYMPEERGLYKKMKVGEQLLYLARLKGMSDKVAKEEITAWMEKFDIISWYGKKIEELSKGMQQKIQFISTVVHRPKLLILDEPFSGLDPINTNLIKDEISELNKSGISIIFSTHRMEQVEQICQNMVMIHKGRKVLEGSIDKVKEDFKQNVFSIEYEGQFDESLLQGASIIEQSDHHITIQSDNILNANQLLDRMIKSGLTIKSFREILPTINEIFIRTAQDVDINTLV